MTREKGRKIIAERVEDFERNKAVLTKKGHGETNIRSNYIDKLFEALGWNMNSFYEIVREYSQRDRSVVAGLKKVDYAFKLNGKLKFFVEAKEASLNLKTDRGAIYQAKRYAYSSNGRAPIVILTDFEEFRVFNVMKAPAYDNPDRELLKQHSMRYTDYLEKWDILWDTFSREAVEGGSLDRLRSKIDKNTKTMDADFLDVITKWRETLAKNIANRNDNLTVQEINEAVQRILDRLIFIRNLEDREIESENTLLDTRKKEDVYRTTLLPLFHRLNKTYNGLLFKHHFSEDIIIDDKTLKEIIREMCYPVSPFQFDIIEPEILGRGYEKFLGSKIRLTDGHRVKIEEKMEVRKAGGIYYTPEYIVEYIINNTVGKKIEGLTPDEIKTIKILDPACGSGSFLLGAYTCLLEYHRAWYAEHQQNKAYKNDWYLNTKGELKVRLDKRADILRNNIFGVDLDHEATEVSIMSLYLKMLDDGFDKGQQDLFFAKGSILPDMSENIKCGNSLVGSDYFDGEFEINPEELRTIQPFDWDAEGTYDKTTRTWIGRGFPEIMKNGGFDCVIGNPPYIFSRDEGFRQKEKEYYYKKYTLAQYQLNTYIMFTENGFRLLTADGRFGFIIPNNWLTIETASLFRRFILTECRDISIVNSYDKVFQDANIDTSILLFSRSGQNIVSAFRLIGQKFVNFNILEPSCFLAADTSIINFDSIDSACVNATISKIQIHTNELRTFASVSTGLKAYQVGKGRPVQTEEIKKNRVYHARTKIDASYIKYLEGRDVQRYSLGWSGEYLRYGDHLAEPRRSVPFAGERILVRQIPSKPPYSINAVLAHEHFLNDINSMVIFHPQGVSIYYLLGLINSKLMTFWFNAAFGKLQRKLFPQFKVKELAQFPIRKIDFSDAQQKKQHDTIVSYVKQMMQAVEEMRQSMSDQHTSDMRKKIRMLDDRLDNQVYQLYELSNEEIKLIEAREYPQKRAIPKS